MKVRIRFLSICLISVSLLSSQSLMQTKYILDSEDEYFISIYPDKIVESRAGIVTGTYYDYSIVLNKDGFKQIDYSNKKLIIIDGDRKYLVFRYENGTLLTNLVRLPKDYTQMIFSDAYLNGRGIADVKASSILIDAYTTYAPSGMLKTYGHGDVFWFWIKDNIPWAEGSDGEGLNDFISFSVEQPKLDKELYLTILNGYVDPMKPYLFYQNNRIKTARIIINETKEIFVSFNDYVEFKTVQLGKNVVKIDVYIDSVNKGTKYNDTCITAIDVDYFY